MNEGHEIHHVKDKGYVESPVRLPIILNELNKTELFKRIEPVPVALKLVKEVHDAGFVDYLRKACQTLEKDKGKSIYPIMFPTRNFNRPPSDIALQVGYYCQDTFTPLHMNSYPAAIGSVNCSITAANAILEGYPLAYSLVRPPGHHAEHRTFGGFCYLNSTAVAAHHLSKYGKVAVLDVDYHHGNGTQDIFYNRADVLTVSIHGAPPEAYPHFSGFKDEKGEGEGKGFNVNYPLPNGITPETYMKTLQVALNKIKSFEPTYLIIALGLDTARLDPTGTWNNTAKDFKMIGGMIGKMNYPTLVVQEGGYRTRTLGMNAVSFFEGLYSQHRGH